MLTMIIEVNGMNTLELPRVILMSPGRRPNQDRSHGAYRMTRPAATSAIPAPIRTFASMIRKFDQ